MKYFIRPRLRVKGTMSKEGADRAGLLISIGAFLVGVAAIIAAIGTLI